MALLPGCAAPRLGIVRELAREKYIILDRGQAIGSEEFVLTTTPKWGREIQSTITHSGVNIQINTIIQIAPDWSARNVTISSSPGKLRAAWDGDRGPAFGDSVAFLLVWLRTNPLEAGSRKTQRVLYYDSVARELRERTFVIDRVPDRGRRLCYRFRFDLGAWWELETDHRDLPLLLRSGSTEISREDIIPN
ncbi:MAG: hypothetical protein ACKVS6_09720 [Planctomycetota bacterium]